MFRRFDLLFVAALCGAPIAAAAASGGLLDGELGRWLEKEAAPQLLDTLDRHPRFNGEILRIVPMRNGEPISATDRLNLTIQRALEHRLLQSTGVRIATQGNPGRCDLRTDIPYLLGVEVGGDGPNRHRVFDPLGARHRPRKRILRGFAPPGRRRAYLRMETSG